MTKHTGKIEAKEQGKIITTIGVYSEDVQSLSKVMERGELFRDRFHKMVIKETKVKKQ